MSTLSPSTSVQMSNPQRYVELGRLITEITRASEEIEIYRAIARHLCGIVAIERASVGVILPDRTLVALHALDGLEAVPLDKPLPLHRMSLHRAVEGRESVQTTPAVDSPHIDMQMLADAGMRRGLVTPLMGRDTVHGTINVARTADELFSAEDQLLICQVADLVSTTLERVWLIGDAHAAADAAEVYAQRLELLNEVSHELAGALTEDQVFAAVVDALPWIVPYDRVSYAVALPGGDQLRVSALRGHDGGAGAGTIMAASGTMVGRVIAESRPVYVANAATSDEPGARMLGDLDMGCAVGVPVEVAGTVEASLNVASAEPDAYGGQERGILTMFGRMMGSTIERVRAAELLDHRACHDDLTGLANRREFTSVLEETLERVATTGVRASVGYLDIDHFKTVNDSHGHAAGDGLLLDLTRDLLARLADRDLLARLGGDEFALVLEGCSLGDALGVAERLRQHVADTTFMYGGQVLPTSLSVGVAELQPGMTTEAALREADAACYEAKRTGRNRVAVAQISDDLGTRQQHEAECVRMIKNALRDDDFELHAQPIVTLAADPAELGPVCELLVRMRDADNRLVMPGTFIDIAERYGLIAQIDQWVVRNAVEWISSADAPRRGLCTVNVSAVSVGSPEFLDEVVGILRSTTVPTDRLCFEITETAAIRRAAQARRFMSALSALGCRFALDDFGSGFSSFAALKDLPVHYIKIDGTLVRDIVVDPVDKAVVQAIQTLVEALDVDAIAEFVEDDETRDMLIAMGVSYGQGFGLGRPAPITVLRPV